MRWAGPLTFEVRNGIEQWTFVQSAPARVYSHIVAIGGGLSDTTLALDALRMRKKRVSHDVTIPRKRVPPSEKPPVNSGRLGHPLGAGSEAAEGIHGVGVAPRPGDRTALEVRSTGVNARDGAARAGSEPLLDRSVEHKPGYGGEGGAPRTSANEREHLDADGRLASED